MDCDRMKIDVVLIITQAGECRLQAMERTMRAAGTLNVQYTASSADSTVSPPSPYKTTTLAQLKRRSLQS